MAQPQELFNPDSYPRIVLPWRLRNDQANLVLYKWEADDFNYRVLSPSQAMIFPFFNGKMKMSDIWREWLKITEDSNIDQRKLFTKILVDLLFPDKIIDITGKESFTWSRENNFVPDFKNYKFPVERTELPISVIISLSNRCPANCIYCYDEKLENSELTYNDWVSFFDQLCKYDIGIVNIAGADPLIRKDSIRILKALVDRNFAFNLSTKNFISTEIALQLLELNIGNSQNFPKRILQISIDSIDDQIAEKVTSIPNYLNLAKKSVLNLLKAGIIPRIKAVLTSINLKNIDKFVTYFETLGIKEIEFVPYERSLYRHNDYLFISEDEKIRLSELFRLLNTNSKTLTISYQNLYNAGSFRKMSKNDWDDRAQCSGGRSTCIVKPNGDVMLCGEIPHKCQYVVGNILKSDLKEIWHSEKLDKLLHPEKKMFIGTPCFNCNDFISCTHGQGYCYRSSLIGFGTIYSTPPQCFKTDRQSLRIT